MCRSIARATTQDAECDRSRRCPCRRTSGPDCRSHCGTGTATASARNMPRDNELPTSVHRSREAQAGHGGPCDSPPGRARVVGGEAMPVRRHLHDDFRPSATPGRPSLSRRTLGGSSESEVPSMGAGPRANTKPRYGNMPRPLRRVQPLSRSRPRKMRLGTRSYTRDGRRFPSSYIRGSGRLTGGPGCPYARRAEVPITPLPLRVHKGGARPTSVWPPAMPAAGFVIERFRARGRSIPSGRQRDQRTSKPIREPDSPR